MESNMKICSALITYGSIVVRHYCLKIYLDICHVGKVNEGVSRLYKNVYNRTVCRTQATNTVCLFYMNKRPSGFAIPTTELEKACTLFTEINHCILTR